MKSPSQSLLEQEFWKYRRTLVFIRVGRYWIQARDQVGLYGDTHNIKKMTLKMKFIP